MPDCDYNCEACDVENCDSRTEKARPNEHSNIKKIIAILSGKGGVGKSYVTSLVAVYLARDGYKVGIMDADVTGPSIPKAFGLKGMLSSDGTSLYPKVTDSGIRVVSSNLLMEKEDEPIIWRGPLLASLVRQFYEDVAWGDLDYLLIDMPPGTGDIALSIFQLLPIDELYIVTSPQDLVSLIVTKAIKMAEQMHIKVSGVIENMSYIVCPDCGSKIELYGHSSSLDDVIAHIPLNPDNTLLMDTGLVESAVEEAIIPVVNKIKEGK
ncbi:MAG: Mrp/NBP35 family ATP-binding protein [Coprobacillus sp.]|nr:Mrp/NBP35 family ATP-binding protein [Coprobacillus sp.]